MPANNIRGSRTFSKMICSSDGEEGDPPNAPARTESRSFAGIETTPMQSDARQTAANKTSKSALILRTLDNVTRR